MIAMSSIRKTNNPSFGSAKDITLEYVLKQRKHLLPHTMKTKIMGLLASTTDKKPTLRELHVDTYTPLLNCKTLEEAQKMYPEFAKIKEATMFENSKSPNVKIIKKAISLKDLTLKLLQDSWAKLMNQDDIAKDLGLSDRHGLDFIKKKIGFVNRDKNYTTLLKASDEIMNAEIAQKTRNFNIANPKQMYERNKHAAQGCKTQAYKEAQAKRIVDFYNRHPERRKVVGAFTKAVWDKIPEVREKLIYFSQNEATNFEKVVNKKALEGKVLSYGEEKIRKGFFKRFWNAYPECKVQYKEACKLVSAEMKKQYRAQN